MINEVKIFKFNERSKYWWPNDDDLRNFGVVVHVKVLLQQRAAEKLYVCENEIRKELGLKEVKNFRGNIMLHNRVNLVTGEPVIFGSDIRDGDYFKTLRFFIAGKEYSFVNGRTRIKAIYFGYGYDYGRYNSPERQKYSSNLEWLKDHLQDFIK